MSKSHARSPEKAAASRRDLIVAASCGAGVALMIAASFAAVPFYDWFCRTTGYGGRTQVATAAPAGTLDRTVTVRFDGNVAGGLPWRFEPERPAMEVRLGEVITLNYQLLARFPIQAQTPSSQAYDYYTPDRRDTDAPQRIVVKLGTPENQAPGR